MSYINHGTGMEEAPRHPGAKSIFTEKLEFLLPENVDSIPVYRVMDRKGQIMNPDHDPKVRSLPFYCKLSQCV